MKNIKKFSFIIALTLIVSCFVPMLTGCFKTSDYTQFKIEYTVGLEFFVGEEYNDPTLKGVATKTDDTTEDVTDKMTVDSSTYNKDVPGTYKIYCEFEDIKLSYEVKVVEEMTNLFSITRTIEPCFQKAFKEQDGVLEFSATHSELVDEDLYLRQTLQYKVENNVLKEHYIIECTDESELNTFVLGELLYIGDLTTGTLTNKIYTTDDEIPDENSVYYYDVNSKQGSYEEFEEAIPFLATLYEASIYLDASQFLNIYEDYYPLLTPVKLIKSENVYTITLENDYTIKIDTDGFMSEYGGIELSKTTDIPTELIVE